MAHLAWLQVLKKDFDIYCHQKKKKNWGAQTLHSFFAFYMHQSIVAHMGWKIFLELCPKLPFLWDWNHGVILLCPANASVWNQPKCSNFLIRSQLLQINAARNWSPWKPIPGGSIPRRGTTFAWTSTEDDFVNQLDVTPYLLKGLKLPALLPFSFSFPLLKLIKLRQTELFRHQEYSFSKSHLQGLLSAAVPYTELNSVCTLPLERSHILVLTQPHVEREHSLASRSPRYCACCKLHVLKTKCIFLSWNITGTTHTCRGLCLGGVWVVLGLF